jgi:hypothetical protein
MSGSQFSKQGAKILADDLRRDFLSETFVNHHGKLQVIYAISIAPYSIRKRHELVRLYIAHLNKGIITTKDIDYYLEHCVDVEYTVVAVVGTKDENCITPYLYPIQKLSTKDIEVFTFNFLNA